MDFTEKNNLLIIDNIGSDKFQNVFLATKILQSYTQDLKFIIGQLFFYLLYIS